MNVRALAVPLTVPVVLAAAVLAAGAEERPTMPRWAPSLAAGLTEAGERECALLVVLNMDKERGNQQMVDEVYTSPEFHEAAKHCVIAVASMFQHASRLDPSTGKRVCERFGSVTCDEHRALEETVRHEWLHRGPKDDVESPRHFFLAPDGKILFEKVWTMPVEDLTALMKRASELCTPEKLAKWDTLEGRLERALDPSPAVRDIALAELIAANDAAIDERLAKEAKAAKDAEVAASILAAFARAETPERRALAVDALSHKAPEVRMRVAYAMGQSGSADHLAPLVARIAKEKEDGPKGSMARAIGLLVGDRKDEKEGKEAKKVLLKAAAANDDARLHAAIALAPWAAEKDVKGAMKKILVEGGSQELRSAAVWTLGMSGDASLVPDLKEAKGSIGRWDWKLKGAIDRAIDKLSGKDTPGYEEAPAKFAPDPAVDTGKKDEPPGPGGFPPAPR